MFKKLYNQAKLTYTITPRSPFLIKSGQVPADPTRPDMECVRTFHATLGETVYIPGSSMKGVIRSHSEKILRTLEKQVKDPFNQDKSVEQDTPGPDTYVKLCYAAKTFGSTMLASRVRFTDAYPVDGTRVVIERRNGVAIDRILGSAKAGALYDLECVSTGTFQGEITLRNFTLWQLGLIAFSLRDLDEGYVHIGLAKSRGFGSVACQVSKLEIITSQPFGSAQKTLPGVGALVNETERNSYKLPLAEHDQVDLSDQEVHSKSHFLGTQYHFANSQIEPFFESLVETPWASFLKSGE